MAGGRFSVEAVFKAKDRITAPVTRMQNRIGKFTRSASAGFDKLNRKISKTSAGIKKGAQVIAAASVITAAAFAPVIAAGANFEQAITNVGAVGLKTRAQIAPLEKMALELGKTTKFTATEAANAMEILARAGFETKDILAATPAVLAAAAASGLEIAEVADHVSNALKGMGLATDQAARVADVLALASSKTNSSIGSLGESLSNVSSTARELNIPLEDTVAAVASLQDVGLDASVAGSAFNTMLTKMAAPTTAMQKKMRRFGISFKDAKGNMLPLQQVLEQLSIASQKAGGNFDKVAFLAELVGLRGQKAASNLAALYETGKLKTLTKELYGAKGAAEEMAKLRMNTVIGSFTLLQSAIDGVKVRIFGMNGGPLKDVIDRMTKWVSKNEELIASRIGETLSWLIDHLGQIGTALKWIGIGLAVFYTFAAAVKIATVAMAAFNLVMSLNPLGLIVLAVAAVIGSVVLLVKKWDWFKEKFMAIPGPVIAGFELMMGPIGWMIGAAQLVMKAWEPVKLFFSDLWGRVSKIMEKVNNFTGGFFGGDEPAPEVAPSVVSPQDRIARSIEERVSTNRSEVTIMDQTGRAEVTGGGLGPGLSLLATGAF